MVQNSATPDSKATRDIERVQGSFTTLGQRTFLEIDPNGSQRIVFGNQAGEWASYHEIAVLHVDETFIIGLSPYFEGEFPADMICHPLVVRKA